MRILTSFAWVLIDKFIASLLVNKPRGLALGRSLRRYWRSRGGIQCKIHWVRWKQRIRCGAAFSGCVENWPRSL